MEKTNVMRILDQKKIPYHHYEYDNSQAYSGTEVADMLGQDPKVVYKTLVTVAKSKKNYVFVIPVEEELDLKKVADLVKTRIEVFPEISEKIDFFEELPDYDVAMYTHKKMKTNSENSLEVL